MCIVKGCEKSAPSGSELCSDCYVMLSKADLDKAGTTFIKNMRDSIESLAVQRESLLVIIGTIYKASSELMNKYPDIKKKLDEEK